MALAPNHIADLRGSGLTDETIREAGLYSETDSMRISQILNWDRPADAIGPAMVFPFVDIATGKANGFARVKPDQPRLSDDGKPFKYEQPRGKSLRAYIPPDALPVIETNELLGITEGEKKALAATQSGLPTVGLCGVWSWQQKRPQKEGKPFGPRLLIPDLAGIDWQGRNVWIGFDFDERRNHNVNHAAAELARVLSNDHGAIVTIIEMPPGPRKEGYPSKMAVDDFLVAFGAERLRDLIAEQMDIETETKSLDQWRRELSQSRVESLDQPGVYLDRSPTGSGKSFADTDAMQAATTSLIVLPCHKHCRELEQLCESKGISGVAYPELSKYTCENIDVAEKALESGLSVLQAICPTCEYRDGCEYHAILEVAELAPHKICTHTRGSLSFEQLAAGRKFISIHEDSTDFLRPGYKITAGLKQVSDVAYGAYQIAKRRQNIFDRFSDRDTSEAYFFYRMHEVATDLAEILAGSPETKILDIPVSAGMQRGCDRRLWEAIQESGIWPHGETMQLVKFLTAGEICELVVRVDEVFSKGGEKKVHRSICGVRQTKLPTDKTTWLADATAERRDIETLAGQPVRDMTPRGELEQKHPILQIPVDITKRTSRGKVVGILQELLVRLPQDRVGIICHREHVKCLTDELGERVSLVEHFRGGESRGSNRWIEECDCVIVLGTPRVPPSAIRDRLIKIGLPAAAARDEKMVGWESDYWSAITTTGQRMTVKSLAYRDHDWHRAHQQIVRSELIQAIGRGRSVTDSGIPVLVLTTENLGLKIFDFDVSPLTNSELNVIKTIGELTELPATGKLTELPANNNIGESSVSRSAFSTAIAAKIFVSDRQVRKILNGLHERNFVDRVGERGGWILRRPPLIDLYAAAGLVQPDATPTHPDSTPTDRDDLQSMNHPSPVLVESP